MRAVVSSTVTAICISVFATSVGQAADAINLTARVYPVGKWAEGMAYDGQSLWVAESGQRSIAQLDFDRDGRVARHVSVGRLPVNMLRGNDGAIYTLVQTDKLIYQMFPGNRQGKAIGGLEGCPNGLAGGGQYLWVLTWPTCSSEAGRVIRVDPRSGQKKASDLLAQEPNAIAEHQGNVWVTHNRGQALSIIDGNSLTVRRADVPGAALYAIAANGANVYVGGTLGEGGNQGLVALINPSSMQEAHRVLVDQPVAVITADDRSVVAVGRNGKVWIFSAATLELQRTITVNAAGRPIDPKAVLIVGESLFISNGQQQGENGAVLYLALWRPQQGQASPRPAPAPGGGAGAGNSSSNSATACPYQVVNVNDATGLWMYEDPDPSAPKVMGIPPNSRGLVADRCLRDWCHVTFRGQSGWVERRNLQAICN